MQKTIFLDIDDCLIETSRLGKPELDALEKSLVAQKIPKASKITEEFGLSFHRLYDSHQGKKLDKKANQELQLYMDKLHKLQNNIIHEYGQVKKWSRECFLYLAAEKFDVALSSTQIKTSTFALWKSITENNPFYPDALNFLKNLLLNKIPFYLISSSDCRLQFDDNKKLFIYDPQYSKNLKLERLNKFIKLKIPKENIFIGDPYDKPNLWVFQEALEKSRKDNPGIFTKVMVGDSVKNDLLPAKEAGMEKLILVLRHKKLSVPLPEGIEVIKSFEDLIS